MKKQVLFGALLVLVILVAAVAPVAGKANKIEFTGASVAGPVLDPGVCHNPGGNEHCRGMILVASNDMTDDRLDGTETVMINFNFRPAPPPIYIVGPWWGTSQIVNDENNDNYWDVSFTGERDEQGFGHIRAVAHGRGDYEGLKAFYSGIRRSPNPAADFEFSGYILEPGSY